MSALWKALHERSHEGLVEDYMRLMEQNAKLVEALKAAHAAGELGAWEGCPPEGNCLCCEAWRKARRLRDAALRE